MHLDRHFWAVVEQISLHVGTDDGRKSLPAKHWQKIPGGPFVFFLVFLSSSTTFLRLFMTLTKHCMRTLAFCDLTIWLVTVFCQCTGASLQLPNGAYTPQRRITHQPLVAQQPMVFLHFVAGSPWLLFFGPVERELRPMDRFEPGRTNRGKTEAGLAAPWFFSGPRAINQHCDAAGCILKETIDAQEY